MGDITERSSAGLPGANTCVTADVAAGGDEDIADSGSVMSLAGRDEDIADSGLAPLTPRPVSRTGRWRKWTAGLAVAVVVVSVSVLIYNLLGDAALFFYNADEAIERRGELGSRRFKVQGTPLDEPVVAFRDDQPVLVFAIGFNGAVVDVVHIGDPPDLFQPGVPVVLEGFWQHGPGPDEADDASSSVGDGWHFASDRMLVKHDNDYRQRDVYEERIEEADRSGTVR